MIQIRQMRREDCPAVAKLQSVCFSTPWSLKSLEDMESQPGGRNYVAVKDGVIVGYVGMLAVLDEADITNVAVEPEQRRQGIGRLLVSHLKEQAQKEEIRHIFLEVRKSNLAAIRLYEEAGFSQSAIRKNYYDKPREDALIMEHQSGM